MKSLHDREIAETRIMILECRLLMIETRKDIRATAALQKSNAKALKQLLGPRHGKPRLSPYPQTRCRGFPQNRPKMS